MLMKTRTRFRLLAMATLAVLVPAAPVAAGDWDPKFDESLAIEYLMEDIRDMRFCEMLPILPGKTPAYNTSGLRGGCPADKWDALDVEALKAEFGVDGFIPNGPKYWMMDAQKLTLGGVREFGGIKSQWVGWAPTAGLNEEGGVPYQTFHPQKTQYMVYDSGKKVFELVSPDGDHFVLQAHAAQFSMEDLETLGDRFQNLPDGWSWNVRVLEESLILDLKPGEITGIGDEFYQYYTRIPDDQL